MSALSDPIDVSPGYIYRSDAHMHVLEQSHSVVFELQFFDEAGERLSSENVLYRAQDAEEWLNQWYAIQVEAQAPPRTETMRILFHSGVPSITEAYFDDVSVVEIEQNFEPPTITVLNEPHHSNGMDDKATVGDYTIIGELSDAGKVYVDGKEAPLFGEHFFSAVLELHMGRNRIEITAEDELGIQAQPVIWEVVATRQGQTKPTLQVEPTACQSVTIRRLP